MSDLESKLKPDRYIAIIVQKTSGMFVDYRVGPSDNHKMAEWLRFDLGELNALELIKVYHLKLGYSEADWKYLQSRLRLADSEASGVYAISPMNGVRLYFMGLGVGCEWLKRKVGELEFRDEHIKDIFAGKWPFKLSRKPYALNLLVKLGDQAVQFAPFFHYQGDEFTSKKLLLFACWGERRRIPLITSTLYWDRSSLGDELPPEIIDQARQHIERLITLDPDLHAGLNAILLGLADGPASEGVAWQISYDS